VNRRQFTTTAVALTMGRALTACTSLTRTTPMYGLIGRVQAKPGQRDALIAILLAGTEKMRGCLSYVVAEVPTDPDSLWITEVWDNQESHEASLSLPSVKEAISRGRPMIAGFSDRFETRPVGGQGLATRKLSTSSDPGMATRT
jgi:quinol monooxygenase YgiN